MPFRSKAQARFMFANKPKTAKKWADEMKKKRKTKHPIKPLPDKVRKSNPRKKKRG